jgi:hypothetical protein
MYSNRFILTTSGTVTASGVFVPKAFFTDAGNAFQGGNIGYGDGIRPMIEPDKIWMDATNIGRCVHTADPTEYSYIVSGTNQASPIFKTVTFHTMANETKFTVAFQLKAVMTGDTGTPGSWSTTQNLQTEIYYIQSGSSNQTLTQAGTYDVWTSGGSQNLMPAQGFWNAGNTYERVNTGRRLRQLSIPSQITGSGGEMQLRFKFRGGLDFSYVTGSMYAKYIEVMTGRDLGLNFKTFVIGSPEYASIGAEPIVPPAGAQTE